MRLHLVRDHYSKRIGNTWIPKLSFKNVDEIKERTGFDPNKCLVYTCSLCSNLHMRSPDWKNNYVS